VQEVGGKKIGIWILTFFVAGTIVGSGVYMLPASLASFGSIGLFSWAVMAVGAIFLALVFAKMGSLMPLPGGPYAYANAEFGEFAGFQTAYCYWFSAWVGNASLIPPTIGYLAVFYPGAMGHHLILGIILIWIFALTNIFGVKNAGIVGFVLTIIKYLPLLIVVAIGWMYFHPAYITHNFNISGTSGISAFTLAAALTLWSFVGVESATVPAGSVINPKKNIPRATIIGTVVAAALYIITCTFIMGMIPMKELAQSTSPFALAGQMLLGSWGAGLITIGALCSLLGGINAFKLLETQVAMAAAHDNMFPKVFGYLNKHGVPMWGIIITSSFASLLLYLTSSLTLMNQFELFILAATTMAVIPYLYTSIAQIIYVNRNKGSLKGVKKSTFVAVIGGAFSLFAIISTSHEVIYIVMILLLISIPLYAVVKVQKNKKNSSNKLNA